MARKRRRSYGAPPRKGIVPFAVAFEAPSGGRTGGFVLSTHRNGNVAEKRAKTVSKRSRLMVCVIHRPTRSALVCFFKGRKV